MEISARNSSTKIIAIIILSLTALVFILGFAVTWLAVTNRTLIHEQRTVVTPMTDYIAVDIYLQYLEAVMKVVNGSLATKDYPGANMNELKNGLADARQALNSLRMEVQIKENALISAQQQIRFIRQQLSSKMSDRVLGNYQFSRVN